MKWFLLPFKKYAEFDGRSRRKEYWMFQLFNLILYLIVMAFAISLSEGGDLEMVSTGIFIIYGTYALASVIPSLALTVRRLHDVGKSGWFIFIGLIPIIGGIWLLILFCTDSDLEENEYGPNPKLDDLDVQFQG